MLFCGTAFGQAEVWACQVQASAGLKWGENHWASTSFKVQPYLIRFDGKNSTYGAGEKQYQTVCSKQGDNIRCNDSSGGTILLNTETGTGGTSELFGVMMKGAKRDTLSVTAIQCTKF